MKAMILAAGQGTRLQPLTLAVAKPVVPVVNTPLLARTLRLLAQQGIREVAVNLFHRPETIQAALEGVSQGDVSVHYSHEEMLLGTAGGVKCMEAFLNETFLVLYGDNLYHANFAPLMEFHKERNALATLATFTAPNPSACGLLLSDETGRVTRFEEKPPLERVFTDQANAGVYILEPEVLQYVEPETVSDWGKDIFPRLLAECAGRVFARPLNGYLQDTGTLPAYRQAHWDLLEGRAGPPENGVHPTARISPGAKMTGRSVVGAYSAVKVGARLHDCILWNGVFVDENATVTGAILGDNVEIGANAHIGEGAVLANGVVVAENAVVAPGTHLSPFTAYP